MTRIVVCRIWNEKARYEELRQALILLYDTDRHMIHSIKLTFVSATQHDQYDGIA